MFPYLHVHSYFSFLEGLTSPGDLVQSAVKNGIPALALTDTHNLTGAVEFADACRDAGIQAIHGIEVLTTAPEFSLDAGPGLIVLLSKDAKGWHSLCEIASAVQPPEPILFDQIAEHYEGLICLTGGVRGTLHQLALKGQKEAAERTIKTLSSVFGDNLFVELQISTRTDFQVCLSLASLAHRNQISSAATHSVYYLELEQARLQRLVSAIRINGRVDELPEPDSAPPDAYMMSPGDFQKRFESFPSALEGTVRVAELCKGGPSLEQTHFPTVEIPNGVSPEVSLQQRAEEGAMRLYGSLSSSVESRLQHELTIINQLGFAPIFLIMQEIITFAGIQGIPTASRGSASSSLVAHCLGITTPDPIKHNLYFERFLNPARQTPPDIDTDICSRRRDEVIHHVIQRYGPDRVAMVATISRLRDRSALREAAKAYGLPSGKISTLVNALPWRWRGPRRGDVDENPFNNLLTRFKEPLYQQIIKDAAELIGQPDHLSVHPGGVVIAPVPIHQIVPTQRAPKGIHITQFDLESIEKLGLVKFDLLGIRGLSVLGEVAGILSKERKGNQSPLSVLDEIPEDDDATSETIRNARTIGCFQIESPGMRATLREIQAQSIDDILAALALYRPGPLTGGLKDAFVRRHLGLEEVQQLHPALTPLLAETYGVILYQEQVLRIAHELAGLSLEDSDILRRAMSHFDPGKEMVTLRERFVAGAAVNHHIPEETSIRIWELMAAFAGYGFPKAHAASYAVISWRAAWCKTHYPDLFMAAVLAGGGGYYRQRTYLNESRRMGLRLRPPHVNFAQPAFSLVYKEDQPILFMGLEQVRELTQRTQKRILENRPFQSLNDFLVRVDPRPVEARNLAVCGALEGFGTIPSILSAFEGGWKGGQLPLFPFFPESEEDWNLQQKVEAQKEVLGAGLDAHPLELVSDKISGAMTTLEALLHPGELILVAGIQQTLRKKTMPNGQRVQILTLEDLEGTLDILITNQVSQEYRTALSGAGPYLIEGVVETRPMDEELVLIAKRVEAVV